MEELHLQVCGGFGNRLRALVSGICWAEDLNRTLHIYWWQFDRACMAPMEKLLDLSSIPSWVQIHPGFLEQPIECLQPSEFIEAGYPSYIKSYGQFHNSDPERWLRHLRALRPSRLIAQRVALIPRLDTLGIHIRRGDNLRATEESPLSAYIEEIWKHHRETKNFVVSTDCSEARHLFQLLFPERSMFPARVLFRYCEEGVYEGVVDFFSLAVCPTILGSAHSSFTDMAAAYGGADLKIIRVRSSS